MSGATIAYLHEPSGDYLGTPTDTTYKVPGKNPVVEDLSFENALTRMRYPDDPEVLDAVAQTFEGAISLTWTQTTPWYLNHVFGQAPSDGGESSAPYTYTWDWTNYLVDSSRWYFGLEAGSATTEREIKGAVFGSLSYDLSIGDEVRVSVTGFYGDEAKNTSVTPGTLQGKDVSPMVFHGGSLSIPTSTAIVKPQSATLDITTNVRPQRGWDRKPKDAVLGAVETNLSLSDIYTDTDQLSLAYGNSSAPATSSGVDGAADGELAFTSGGTNALTWDMTGITHNTYGWSELANRDADSLEDNEYIVNQVSPTAESAESGAL